MLYIWHLQIPDTEGNALLYADIKMFERIFL